jgi:peptide/nickel transport system ATP-binding protein/oligopeptide transport system ATP-binding protein
MKTAMSDSLLRIEQLRTSFATELGPVRAVDDVSLSLDAARTLGLVGESGSGKTVTALSVMGLLDSAGRVEPGSRIVFQGRDLVGLEDAELRRIRGSEMAMIFQEPSRSLNPVLPVGWQIVETLRAHEGMSRGAANARAEELLDLVGIPEPRARLRDYAHQLSGGMCQRVMIAMALACNPKLLIADEPTTALDVTVQAQILELILELRETFAMAVLLITHDLGVVAQIADDVAVMYAGKIVETGPVGAVFASPQHPYTEALMRSTPLLGMRYTGNALHAIAGQVPSLHAMPTGCRFRARCDYRFDLCSEQPGLFSVGEQESACWLCQHGTRAASEPLVESGR